MNRDMTIKKLYYQSWHRGCKETDLLLGAFAKAHLEEFNDAELAQYAAFIEENDWDIYAWLTHKEEFPAEHVNRVTDLLREFKLY
jgi:antitoxin CptB